MLAIGLVSGIVVALAGFGALAVLGREDGALAVELVNADEN